MVSLGALFNQQCNLGILIATGKSTFIKILEDASMMEDWEITPEPVSTWTQIDGQVSLCI